MATTRIQLRRGTEAQWTAANPTLAAGEIGIETDTNTFKFGDGTTAWSSLDYALADTVDDYIPLSQKGVASGVATLDGSGKVPYNQIPSIDELSQDAVNTALVAGSGITKVYNDGANTITVSVDTSVIATKAELAEVSQDSINDALVAGTGLDKTYDDVNNLITIDIDSTVVTLTGTQTLTNKTLTSPVINTPDINSPNLTGVPTAPTATSGQNSTQVANTEFVTSAIANLISSAPAALDTLNELSAALGNDANFSSTVTNSLALKAPLANPTFSGTASFETVTGVTKSMVGLANVDNTSDINKPISNAVNAQLSTINTAIETKAPHTSPVFTGTVVLPSTTSIGDISQIEIAYLNGSSSNIQTQIDGKASLTGATFTGTVSLPSDTSIGNVSASEIEYVNGVTSAIQTQLDSKAPTASPTFTGTVSGITALMVGLENVNNTSDTNKPISTATQTALNLKANIDSPTFTGTVILPTGTVTSEMIANGAVVTDDLADGAVTTAKIADGAITAAKVPDGSVVTSKIADSGITTIKINDAAVTTAKIVDGAVTSAKIADGTIVNADINDSAAIDWTKLGISSTVSATEIGYVDGVTSAIQTQIDTKAPIASPTFTGTVSGITATMVGLSNVDNTSDANKPISTATQTALDLKSTIDSPTFTGTPAAPTATVGTDTTQIATTAFVQDAIEAVVGAAPAALNTLSELADALNDDASFSSTVTNSLALKAPLASPTFTGTVTLPSTTSVGDVSATELGYVNGVTSAIQTQIDTKAPIASPTFTGTVTVAASGVAFTDGTQTKEGVPSRTEIVQSAGAYNLSTVGVSLRDELIEISHTGGSAVDVTIPADATTDFPIGTSIDLLRTNSGKVRVVGAAGVTVNATPGAFLREQWSGATLFKRAANTWVLLGDLATS